MIAARLLKANGRIFFFFRNEVLGLLFYASMLAAGIIVFLAPEFILLKILIKLAAGEDCYFRFS